MTGPEGFSQVGRVDVKGALGELDERVHRRPDPRFGIGLGGVGMLMILVGIVAWAGDVAADSVTEPGDSPNTWLGVIESLVIIAIGVVLLVRFKRGPLATAGVVASAIGVPVCMAFLTFDPASTDPDAYISLPFNLDAIAVVSLVSWLAAFAWLPYGKGRTFYLAASSVFLWLYVAEKIEEGAIGWILTLPFYPIFGPFITLANEFDEEGFESPEPPDATTIGIVTLAFGLGFYGLAVWLDRKGYRGSATPFLGVGAITVPIGLGHLGGELQAAGVGILLILLGVVLAAYGANQGRRFTTWLWCLGAGLGGLLIIGDFTEDDLAVFGIAAIILGTFAIVMAYVVAERFDEPDEMTSGPSGLRLATAFARRPQAPSPWPTQQPYGTQPQYGQPQFGTQPQYGQRPQPPYGAAPHQPQPPQQPPSGTAPSPQQPPQQPSSGPPPAQPPTEPQADSHQDWRPPPPPPPPPPA